MSVERSVTKGQSPGYYRRGLTAAVELFHLRRFPMHIMVYKLISYFVACYIGTLSWCVQGIKSIGSYNMGLVMYDRGR